MTAIEPRASRALTIVELMITTAIMVIVGLAIGVVIVDGQNGWNTMYGRMNSDVAVGGYAARRKFDAVMRRASRSQSVLASDGSWIEVYSYATAGSTAVDRYWRFYVSEGDLNLEHGELEPKATLDVRTICSNVSACTFRRVGKAAQMTLTLDNGTQTNTIVSAAVMHNE